MDCENEKSSPTIVFLGICERAASVLDGPTRLPKWNLLGLKRVVISPIFPLSLKHFHLGFAVSGPCCHHLKFVGPDGTEIGHLSLEVVPSSDNQTNLPANARTVFLPNVGHEIVFVALSTMDAVVSAPGCYLVILETPNGSEPIGAIAFEGFELPVITSEEIAAVKSDPHAPKSIRISVGCRSCNESVKGYASLDRDDAKHRGWIWFADLPETFACRCSKPAIDLSFIRRNLLGFLCRMTSLGFDGEILPLYEKGSLQTLGTNFRRLLGAASTEEEIHQFIAKNPVLLHQFPATRLLLKPKILTRYVADFGIVTPQRELILIEIEKQTTPILRKNGDITAGLSHAITQVEDWLTVVDDLKPAVLSELGIEMDKVIKIRGVVIAGRDLGNDAMHLGKLKRRSWGRVSFLTFDDVLGSLDALIANFGKL